MQSQALVETQRPCLTHQLKKLNPRWDFPARNVRPALRFRRVREEGKLGRWESRKEESGEAVSWEKVRPGGQGARKEG